MCTPAKEFGIQKPVPSAAAILLVGCLLTLTAPASAIATEKQVFEAEAAELIGGASQAADGAASGGFLVDLSQPGQGAKFGGLPAASKLAIRYASVSVGTISVTVNDQPACKVNVHSSGALTNSFLNAIIELTIPAKATLTISLATNDVATHIDNIIVGDGNLGLLPDIWNLPPLPAAARGDREARCCDQRGQRHGTASAHINAIRS